VVFSDPAFLFYFLPVSLLTYWAIGWRVRNLYLLLVSALFYTSGGGSFLLLVLGSSILTYAVARLMNAVTSVVVARLVKILGISTLLSSLLFWKYLGFVVDQFTVIARSLGDGFDLNVSVVLPIAISFYTFQCVSYVIDVGRGTIPAERNLIRFLCYVLFFPQLIAGPIVRYTDVVEQLSEPPRDRWQSFVSACPRFFWGLSKKVLIADQVGQIADAAFGVAGYQLTSLDTVVGVVAYAIQIYFDFSGYSDMAIGLSRMFGITFPENFRHPYSARTVTDFWRRWHISLSTWFRDYVYIPAGGNRHGVIRTYRNLVGVFILTGFWHGANWTFLCWGLLHGAALIIERVTIGRRVMTSLGARFALRIWTVLVVLTGWLLFRSVDLTHAGQLLRALGGGNGFYPSELVVASLTSQRLLWGVLGLMTFLMPSRTSVGERLSVERPHPLLQISALAVGGLATLYVMSSSFSPFLYFQF